MLEFRSRNSKQLDAAECWIDDSTEEILYGGAKGGGKSFLGCALIFGDALTYPGTHFYIARKELNDLRKYTVPSIHEVFRAWGIEIGGYAQFNGQDNVFNLSNGSKVFLVSCKEEPSDPMFERFGSMQMTRGWLEEAGEIAEAAKSNLWLATGRWRNEEYGLKKKQLLTANPKKGWLKRDFVDPWNRGKLPEGKVFIPALATDNPYLSKDYLKTLEGEKNQVRRQRLWLGDWEYDEDKDSFIEADALEDAFSNTIVKSPGKYLVVDVARFGEDHTVYHFWEGLELYHVERFNGDDTEETKRKIRQYAVTERIPYSNILVDATGIGGGVVDGIRGIRSFVSASSPLPTAQQIREKRNKLDKPLIPKTKFTNLKAQCAYKLAELVNEHLIRFRADDYRDMVIEDLTAMLRYKDIDSEGKIALKSKEDVKAELGRSPDMGDCIVMRMWFELARPIISDDPEREMARTAQRNNLRNSNRLNVQNSSK